LGNSGGTGGTGNIDNKANAPVDLEQSGSIDDGEFEEIDQ
jgi:hypothetical protein